MRIALPVVVVIVAVSFYLLGRMISSTGTAPLLTSNSQSPARVHSQTAAEIDSTNEAITASSGVSTALASVRGPSASANDGANSTLSIKVDFATQIRPILEGK